MPNKPAQLNEISKITDIRLEFGTGMKMDLQFASEEDMKNPDGPQSFSLGQALARGGYYHGREGNAVLATVFMMSMTGNDGAPLYSVEDILDETKLLDEKKAAAETIKTMLAPLHPEQKKSEDQGVDEEQRRELDTRLVRGAARLTAWMDREVRRTAQTGNFRNKTLVSAETVFFIVATNWQQSDSKFAKRIKIPYEKKVKGKNGQISTITTTPEQEALGKNHTLGELTDVIEPFDTFQNLVNQIPNGVKTFAQGDNAGANFLDAAFQDAVMRKDVAARLSKNKKADISVLFPGKMGQCKVEELAPWFKTNQVRMLVTELKDDAGSAEDYKGDFRYNYQQLKELAMSDPLLTYGAGILAARGELFRDFNIEYDIKKDPDAGPEDEDEVFDIKKLSFRVPTREELIRAAFSDEMDFPHMQVEEYIALRREPSESAPRIMDRFDELNAYMPSEGPGREMVNKMASLLETAEKPLNNLQAYKKLQKDMDSLRKLIRDNTKFLDSWLEEEKEKLRGGLGLSKEEFDARLTSAENLEAGCQNEQEYERAFNKMSPENKKLSETFHGIVARGKMVNGLKTQESNLDTFVMKFSTPIAIMEAGGSLPKRTAPIQGAQTIAERKEMFSALVQNMKDLTPKKASKEWKRLSDELSEAQKLAEGLEVKDNPTATELERLDRCMERLGLAAELVVSQQLEAKNIGEGPELERLKLAKRVDSAVRLEREQAGPLLTAARKLEFSQHAKETASIDGQIEAVNYIIEQMRRTAEETHHDSKEYKELMKTFDQMKALQQKLLSADETERAQAERRFFGTSRNSGMINQVLNQVDDYLEHKKLENDGKHASLTRINLSNRMKSLLSDLKEGVWPGPSKEAQEKALSDFENDYIAAKQFLGDFEGKPVPADMRAQALDSMLNIYIWNRLQLEKQGMKQGLCGENKAWKPENRNLIVNGNITGLKEFLTRKDPFVKQILSKCDSKMIEVMLDPVKVEQVMLIGQDKALQKEGKAAKMPRDMQRVQAMKQAVMKRAEELHISEIKRPDKTAAPQKTEQKVLG